MPSMKYGANPQQNNSSDTPVSEGEDILAKYKELYLQNENMVGWVSINGTTINYPVMQSRNSPNFYLKHSFEKEYSDLGVPYIQEGLSPYSAVTPVSYKASSLHFPT